MLKIVNKLIILAFIATQVCACSKYWHSDWMGIIKPPEMDMTPPPGPPIYQQGWREGCESGFKGYGASFTKIFYKWKQDPELVEDPIYYQIWKDAYTYCANYAMASDEHGLGNLR